MFIEETAEGRREILKKMYNLKYEIDSLLQKGFFKELLSFYQWMEKLDGLSNWMNLYNGDDQCEACTSGKMRLIETLIFQLNESHITERIQDLNKQMEKYNAIRELY